jgi:hypothetical protein
LEEWRIGVVDPLQLVVVDEFVRKTRAVHHIEPVVDGRERRT